MANATPTYTSTEKLIECPGCGNDIVAQAVSEVIMDQMGDPRLAGSSTVNAKVRIVGIRVNHDCIPKTTR